MEQANETTEDIREKVEDTSLPSSQVEVTRSSEENIPEFTDSSIFDVSIGLNSIDVDADVIIVDLLSNKYFRLNSTGALIWRLVQQRLTLRELSEQMAQRFNLAPDRAFEIVSTFLKEMLRKGVVASTDSKS